jgi:hypothetical protein
MNGLHRLADLDGKSVGIGRTREPVSDCANRRQKTSTLRMFLTPMSANDDIVRALGNEQVQAAILPAPYAHELMIANQVKLIGWYSEAGSQQLGALFASAKMLNTGRAAAAKFVRAYRRGAADYAGMLQLDRSGKRMFTIGTREIATIIAVYAYPRPAARPRRGVDLSNRVAGEPERRARCGRTCEASRMYRAQKLIQTAASGKRPRSISNSTAAVSRCVSGLANATLASPPGSCDHPFHRAGKLGPTSRPAGRMTWDKTAILPRAHAALRWWAPFKAAKPHF